jgi:hypothetical protein
MQLLMHMNHDLTDLKSETQTLLKLLSDDTINCMYNQTRGDDFLYSDCEFNLDYGCHIHF